MIKAEVDELIDLVLFGDVHEAPWEPLTNKMSGKVDIEVLATLGEDALERVAIAAAILQKYGGGKI